MDGKQVRLLERILQGDAPRCSRRDFEVLSAAIPGALQLESANGADTRCGYVLTCLHDSAATNVAVRAWLDANAHT